MDFDSKFVILCGTWNIYLTSEWEFYPLLVLFVFYAKFILLFANICISSLEHIKILLNFKKLLKVPVLLHFNNFHQKKGKGIKCLLTSKLFNEIRRYWHPTILIHIDIRDINYYALLYIYIYIYISLVNNLVLKYWQIYSFNHIWEYF